MNLKNKLINQIGIVFGSNMIKVISGFLVITLVARVLGPKDYGVFSILLALIAILTEATNFGLNTTLVRFNSAAKNKKESREIIKTVFTIRVLLVLIITLIWSFVLVDLINDLVFGNDQYQFILYIAIIGFIANSFFNFYLALKQSEEKFQNYFHINLFRGISLVIIFFIL
jgi:O-antigen/teichoic acid export membrane protein